MIVIIFCSITGIAAADLNETQGISADYANETLKLDDDFNLATDDSIQDIGDESILNSSGDEDNSVLEKDMQESAISSDTQKDEKPTYGIIDIGANTIKMEIYQIKNSGKPKSLISQSEISVTSKYVENNNLTQKGIDELISILKDFDNAMDLANVKTKYIFATASLRKINNADEVIAAVKDRLGLEIHLLSGEKEAKTSFNAVKDDELTVADGILIDLGGGSCEVINFVNKTVVTSESMPIGANSCYKEYVNLLFPNETEIENIRNRTLHELHKLTAANETQRSNLFAIGGSNKLIKKVLAYLGYIGDDDRDIPVSMLDTLLDNFRQETNENYQIILNIDPERINTFIPGLIITKTVAEYFNVSNLHVCKNGVREGILKEILENESRDAIQKENISLNIADIDINCDENAEILVALLNNVTGTITVKLNNVAYDTSLANGSALVILPKLQSGNYTAKVSYSGDDNYLANSIKVKIHVKSAALDADNLTRGWNSDYDYRAKLVDENGNGIANKLIVFTISGKQYYGVTDEQGIASIKADLDVGTYEVTVSSVLTQNATRTLNVVNRIQNNKDLNVYYGSNAKYQVRIIGEDGNAEIAGKTVDVIIDNKKHTYQTDKDGFITISLDKSFKPTIHTIEIQYKGFSIKNKATVKHTLTSKKVVKVKKSSKKITLTAKLSKKVKNKVIKFKIKGKTYSAKTNKNGAVKKVIKNNFKKGKYGVKITYLNDSITTTLKIV